MDTAGVYRIHYNVKTIVGNGATMVLLINGEPVEDSNITLLLDVSDRTGVATLRLAAEDTVGIGIIVGNALLAPSTNAFLDLLMLDS